MNSPVSYIGGLTPLEAQELELSTRARIIDTDEESVEFDPNNPDTWDCLI